MTSTDTSARPQQERPFHEIDVSRHDFWEQDFLTRDLTFERLRGLDGPTWQPPVADAMFPHEETGYWAVVTNADIRHVSSHPEIFSSEQGISMDPVPAEIQRPTTFFLTMDAPEHTRYRRLISMAFTPRQVRRIEDQIKRNAALIVDELLEALDSSEPVDFMETVAKKLPMKTVSEMIGLDPSMHEAVAYAAESLFSTSDDEYASFEERAVHLMTQLGVLQQSGIDLAAERREDPREDLMTNIVEAEVDGHRLTDEEIGAFMVLLASAGNDTTKQTTAHAFKALVDNPGQLRWLREDLDDRLPAAIDEFVRWASPVLTFARHAVTDTEIGSAHIRAGEKVVMFYGSGSFDETVFDDPRTFDVTRDPNPHVAFGGGGPHFCLGKQLAIMELTHLFRELITRVPEVELGDPEYVYSDFVHGIKRMSIARRVS